MLWSMLAALAVIAAVAGAVLPRRLRLEPAGLPWFWLFFPAACLLTAGWVGVSEGWVSNLGGSARFFWDAFAPAPDRIPFLSHEGLDEMRRQDLLRRWLPVGVAVCAVASVWSWRRRRI